MQIGHIIAQQREQKGINQKELASILNVSSGAVGLWETNKRCPSLEILVKMADYFNISMDVFFVLDRKNKNYIPLELKIVSEKSQKMLTYFNDMNDESQDIIIGHSRELLRQQRLEEKRETALPVAK